MSMLSKMKKAMSKAIGKKTASNTIKKSTKKHVVKKTTKQRSLSVKKAPAKRSLSKAAKKPTKKIVKKQTTKRTVSKKTLSKPSRKKTTTKPRTSTTKKPASKKTTATKKTTSKKQQLPKKTQKPSKQEKIAKLATQQNELTQQLQSAATVEKKIPKYPVVPGAESERIKILVNLLKEMVRKSQISDWSINLLYTRSHNVYLHGADIDDELSSIKEDVLVTIYERYPDGNMGDAKIPIITTDPMEMREQILDAKTTCASAKKPAFELPQPEEGIEQAKSYDENLLHELYENTPKTAIAIATQVRTIVPPDVKLNLCEVHTSASSIRVVNSNNIDFSYHKTAMLIDAVLSYKHDKNTEREFGFSRIAVSPEQLDIRSLFEQKIKIVKDASAAIPNPGFSGDVVLGGRAVIEFFAPHHDINPLVLHAGARLAYQGISNYTLGKPIGEYAGGEQISISTYPTLQLGLGTAPIDEDGTPLRTVDLIRNGVFVQHLATTRYAQYLGVPATGNLSNIHVHVGATREEHLRGNNYFEIVSFSWFNPNPLSGDFSAEIRLGYRWINGKKTAVRGGTFTGNIFKNILQVRFSKESTQSSYYYGPRTILFKNATVTKFE